MSGRARAVIVDLRGCKPCRCNAYYAGIVIFTDSPDVQVAKHGRLGELMQGFARFLASGESISASSSTRPELRIKFQAHVPTSIVPTKGWIEPVRTEISAADQRHDRKHGGRRIGDDMHIGGAKVQVVMVTVCSEVRFVLSMIVCAHRQQPGRGDIYEQTDD